MAYIDAKKQLLQCKIVYFGAGLGGKTTNLRGVHGSTDPKRRGKLLTLETESKPPLLFDFAPLSIGKIKEHKTRFSFYTVPGHSYDNETRKAIMKDVDGVVLVCDSQEDRMEANIDSLQNLEENLQEYKRALEDLPHVIQFNKRDLEKIVPVAEMREKLNRHKVPDFEAIATKEQGVLETYQEIVRIVSERAIKDLGL